MADTWNELLDILDESRLRKVNRQRFINADGIEEYAVRLSREYDPQAPRAVWKKTYHNYAQIELSVFNDWEFDMLSRIFKDKIKGCYQAAKLIQEASPIHSGDTPLNQRRGRKTEIHTIHAGPDLADWRRMKLQANREHVSHIFAYPANFLRLAKSLLAALRHIHSNGLVHCDIKADNIALPVVWTPLPGNEEKYQLTPQWDSLVFIDFGFSLRNDAQPSTTLPLAWHERMSPHLGRRLRIIETLAKERLARFPAECPAGWDGAMLNKAFWSGWADKPLPFLATETHWRQVLQRLEFPERFLRETGWEEDCRQVRRPLALLQSLDWREDLYQLGIFLEAVRDEWGGGCIDISNSELTRVIYLLPEKLKAWGDEEQLMKPAPEKPHSELIREIDNALFYARNHDGQDVFILDRGDYDFGYDRAGTSGRYSSSSRLSLAKRYLAHAKRGLKTAQGWA